MATALLLGEHVHLGLELRVRGDRTRLGQHLAALDVLALDAAEQGADVVTGLPLVEQLAEHLDAGDHGLLDLRLHADDLDLVIDVDDAALHATGGDGAATGDGEDVLDGHQEGLVHVALGERHVVVHGLHELEDLLLGGGVAVQGVEGRDLHDRDVVTRELVLAQQLTHLELHELEQLLVVHHVGLVEGHHDVRHAHLAGEQDVLTGLRHRAVSGRHHEDRAVHLRGTRDHVLDVVSVTRAVDVGVVTALRLVLHVRGGDGDAALALLGGVVDLIEAAHLAAELLAERLGDGSSEGRLAVVDVTDGAHVHVGLRTVELLLRHHRSSCASERGATIRVTTRHVLPKRPQHATRGPVGRA